MPVTQIFLHSHGRWLVLNGFETWSGGNELLERETWRRIACFVVRKVDLSTALALVKCQHFQSDDDVPPARCGGLHSYLGEHPWAWRADDGEDEPDSEWIRRWRPFGVSKKAVSIRPTTAKYLAEASGYDASIQQNINIHIPAGWLMDGLGLRLTDGATIRYIGADGVVRFMDPSVGMTGRSAALIDREAFLGKVRTSIPRTKNENFSHLISMGYQ